MAEVFGREVELASAIETVMRDGTGVAVEFQGAAGIGKTVLLDMVVQEARAAGVLVLETRPSETEARTSLLGLHDLLEPVADDVLPRLPTPQRASLEIALDLAESVQPGPPEAGRLAVAVMTALREVASQGRVLVAIDDVQWLDASTGALLDTALRRLRHADVRVVATRRTGTSARRDQGLSLTRVYGDELRRIVLEPLSVGALHRVIGARLGLSLPWPTLVRVHAASDGNPLYALELARHLGQDAPTPERIDASVPDDLTTLLWRRIRRQPDKVRAVLLVAAMTNRPTTEIVAATLNEVPHDVEAAVDAGVAASLLVADPAGLRVAHPLIGAVMRVRAAPSTRRTLHRRLAAIVADPTEAVVHRALAAAAPDEEVAEALEAAARSPLRRGASTEAADLLHRAVRLTPADRAANLTRRRVRLAEALLVSGDTERASREIGSMAIASIDDDATRVEAVLLLGAIRWLTGDLSEAIALHEDALRSTSDSMARSRLHLRLAWLYEGNLQRSLDHAAAALELIDPVTRPIEYAFALLNRAGTELGLGIRADHDAVARGTALQEAAEAWDTSTIPVDWALVMNDWDRARSLIDRAIADAEEHADETTIGHMFGYRAEVEAWSGDLTTAAHYADAAVQRAESTGQVTLLATALGRRALILAAAGSFDRAEADASVALVMGERDGSPSLIARALAALASVARQREDYRAVDRLLTRALVVTNAAGNVDQTAHRFHGDHLDAVVALGDLSRARDLADRLARRGELGPRPVASATAERGRAAIALAEGRVDDALGHVARSLEHHANVDAPLELGRTMLVAAQVNRRAGRRKAAEALLRSAGEILEAIGANGWAARATADLARLGLQPGPSSGLTPSEERIARLAADGLRNREIANRLFISPKTVEASLARAYAKLDVRSRTELAVVLLGGASKGPPEPNA